jgi:hypothetical protein
MNSGPRNSYPSKKISVLLCFCGPSFLTGVLEGGLGVGYLGILENKSYVLWYIKFMNFSILRA